jgi:hypothetical protein
MCTYACTCMACCTKVLFQCYIKLGVVSLLGVPEWYWSGFISSSCQFWMVWCVLQKWHASMLLPVVLTPRALVLGCYCTVNMVWRDYGLGTQCKNSHRVSHLMTKRFAMFHDLLCG